MVMVTPQYHLSCRQVGKVTSSGNLLFSVWRGECSDKLALPGWRMKILETSHVLLLVSGQMLAQIRPSWLATDDSSSLGAA